MWRLLVIAIAAGTLLLATPKGIPDSDVKVHAPIRHGNLTIFPVTSGTSADTSMFLTLDEGLRLGVVKVGELGALRGTGAMVRPVPQTGARSNPYEQRQVTSGDARVNELAIVNQGDKPLLLLAGEIVSGGKQDRVVGNDRIVAPHSEPVPLGVFCVEPGRWSGTTATFGASKAMAHPQLRKEVNESKDQRKVWAEVGQANDRIAATLAPPAGGAAGGVVGGVAAPRTSSFAVMMEHRPVQDKLAQDSRVFLESLPRGTMGVVVAVNGRPVWADLFASPELFERYRAKLLQSYVVEAMRSAAAGPQEPAVDDARDFLRSVSGRQTTETEPRLYRLTRTEAAGLVTYELESLVSRPLTLHTARLVR